MNKNIRRSIVIAAGVTGAWALGSAAASADELPAALSVPDTTADAADAADNADATGLLGGATGTVNGVVSDVTGTVTDTVSGITDGAADTALRA